ncbi:MAG TPA: HRDC domain-containing protein, partial [Chloroflexota bacterium]|nr:HRDC domain-containing protein [Chloroflexota bacterium]
RTVGLFRVLDQSGCRHQALVGYFDEAIGPCGESCDGCLGLNLDEVTLRRGRTSRGTASAPSWRKPSWQTSSGADDDGDFDTELFDRLRALRRQLADAEGKPAYIVFSDAVLRDMAQTRPRSEAELLRVSGVGITKLARYGRPFLELLRG